jgi:hypothetical protein
MSQLSNVSLRVRPPEISRYTIPRLLCFYPGIEMRFYARHTSTCTVTACPCNSTRFHVPRKEMQLKARHNLYRFCYRFLCLAWIFPILQKSCLWVDRSVIVPGENTLWKKEPYKLKLFFFSIFVMKFMAWLSWWFFEMYRSLLYRTPSTFLRGESSLQIVQLILNNWL